ncbi:MAG: hypothetical protein L6R39_004930 [Caloplaca ligustica]|nr:MAG: hypothetical protein L6R39_004930 [Caloplaca ligustica]
MPRLCQDYANSCTLDFKLLSLKRAVYWPFETLNHCTRVTPKKTRQPPIMISDNDLYSLAVFLGSLSMLLIVLYHFLEVNAKEDDPATKAVPEKGSQGTTQPNPARATKS